MTWHRVVKNLVSVLYWIGDSRFLDRGPKDENCCWLETSERYGSEPKSVA